jgi:hypothetical protein
LSRIEQVIETLEAERADLQQRLAWLEEQIKEFQAHHDGAGPAAPARSGRRATARRASTRRATARTHQVDTKKSIIEFLTKHPGSTAGEVAKGLNLNRGSVSTRLTQLAKSGEIKKAARGYTAE